MKFISFLKEVVTALSGISSKRVCGLVGWITCLLVMIYCTIFSKQAPIVTDSIIFSCLGLLGIDSISNIWKGGHNGKIN